MRFFLRIIAVISLTYSPACCLGTKGSGRLGSGGGKSKSSNNNGRSRSSAKDGGPTAAASSIEKGRRLASNTKKKIKEKSKSIQSTLAEAKAGMTVSSIISQSISIPVDLDLDLEGIKGGIKSGIQDGKGLFFDSLSRVDLEKSYIALLIAELKEKVKTGDISDMIASRLLSAESAMAVKTVRKIIEDFPDHGVKDVFALYPTKDVVASIIALSRLQSASYYAYNKMEQYNNGRTGGSGSWTIGTDLLAAALKDYSDSSSEEGTTGDVSDDIDDNRANEILKERELIADLAHYSRFAHAAYGWKFALLSGKIHFGDTSMLLRKTGLKRRHLIATNWRSKTHLPAYFLARDIKRRKIVLCIRGTLSPKDVLTDLCCTAEDFMSHEEEIALNMTSSESSRGFRKLYRTRARAHEGMLKSARGVANATHGLISSELASNPDYDLIIVGHSLGGGVAAVLGTFWRDTFPGLKVYGYGSPCVGPIDSHPTISNSIVSVVGESDPFSCLSLGHLADASTMLSKFCEDKILRETILNNTRSDVEELDESELKWCLKTMNNLAKDLKAEKFYPPGRVLQMKGSYFGPVTDDVTLTEVSQENAFRDLRFHPRMFDLSLHVPHRYEVLLARIWRSAKMRRKSSNGQ